MSALAELTIFPTDKGISVSPYVSRAVKIISESGLDHELGPMGTVFEGPLNSIMAVVSACMTELQKDSDRIYMVLKVDYRKGSDKRIQSKVTSVKEKL